LPKDDGLVGKAGCGRTASQLSYRAWVRPGPKQINLTPPLSIHGAVAEEDRLTFRI